MIFVGYHGNSDNYRLFDPKTRKITVVTSVRFDEEATYYPLPKTVGVEGETRSFVLLEDDNLEDDNPENNGLEDKPNQEIKAADEISIEDTDEEEASEKEKGISTHNQEERTLRDRKKIRKPEKLNYPQANIAEAEPQTFEEALHSSEANKWEEAIQRELSAHKKNETWFYCPKPENKKAITCKWIFKKKITPG